MIKFLLALWRLISVWKRVKRVDDPPHEQIAGGADSAPPPKRRLIVKSKPTKPKREPWLRQPGETVLDWWARMDKKD